MNAAQSVHPTDQKLSSYGLDRLDSPAVEAVGNHLKRCPICRKRVAEMLAESPVGRVQNAPEKAGAAPLGQSRSRQVAQESKSPPVHALPPGLADHSNYEIKRELGRGGMGIVYLTHNRLTGRDEVLKVVSKSLLERKGILEGFLREIRAAAKLNHANIVIAYAAFRSGESIVFSMEHVDGRDLAETVKTRGPLPAAHACYFIYQAALGLQHAHEHGLVHRDIKPANLMLARSGKKAIVKVLDFGLAKARGEQPLDGGLTGEGQMLGTPDCIAPEQIRDAQSADIRADIYSLGCTLYHLLTGGPPFQALNLWDLYEAHFSMNADPLNLVRTDVPAELAVLVAKMMAKEPTNRLQTPAEVAQALMPFFSTGPKATPAPADISDHGEPALPAACAPMAPDVHGGRPAAAAVPKMHRESLIEVERANSSIHPATAVAAERRPLWLWPSVLLSVLMLGILAGWASGLTRITTPDGTIVLENVPKDSQILVDGNKITVTRPGFREPVEIRIAPGQHGVEVKKDGFTAFRAIVTLKSDETEEVTVRLEPLVANRPAKTPATSGEEIVLSNGRNLDGRATGKALEPAAKRVGATDTTEPRPQGGTPVASGEQVENATTANSTPPGSTIASSPTKGAAPTEGESAPGPSPARGGAPRGKRSAAESRWISLFNHKDLSGWTDLNNNGSEWRVTDDGIIEGRGGGKLARLISDRRDFTNFMLRVTYRFSPNGGGRFQIRRTGDGDALRSFVIQASGSTKIPFGKIGRQVGAATEFGIEVPPTPTPEDVWRTIQIAADGNTIATSLVGGRVLDTHVDADALTTSGAIAVGCNWESQLQIKDILIKELPAGSDKGLGLDGIAQKGEPQPANPKVQGDGGAFRANATPTDDKSAQRGVPRFKKLAEFNVPGGSINGLVFSADGARLAATATLPSPKGNRKFLGNTGQIIVWDVPKQQRLWARKNQYVSRNHTPIHRVWLTADGNTIVTSESVWPFELGAKLMFPVNGSITFKVWDAGTGKLRATLFRWGVTENLVASMSPDGRFFAVSVGLEMGKPRPERGVGLVTPATIARIKVWDLQSLKERCTIPGTSLTYVRTPGVQKQGSAMPASGYLDSVEALAFSPDGLRLAAEYGRSLKLWSLEPVTEIASLKGVEGLGFRRPHNPSAQLHWLNDGKTLVRTSFSSLEEQENRRKGMPEGVLPRKWDSAILLQVWETGKAERTDGFLLTDARPTLEPQYGGMSPPQPAQDVPLAAGGHVRQNVLTADGRRLLVHTIHLDMQCKPPMKENRVVVWDVVAHRRLGTVPLPHETLPPKFFEDAADRKEELEQVKRLRGLSPEDKRTMERNIAALRGPLDVWLALLDDANTVRPSWDFDLADMRKDMRIALSTDGKLLAAGDRQGVVRVYDVAGVVASAENAP